MSTPQKSGLDASTAVRIHTSREVIADEVSRQLREFDGNDDELDDAPEVTPIDRLTEMMRETGDGKARVKVYRQDPHSKVFEFCCEYMPEQFEEGGLDMLRRDWGPGVYQLKLYATHPSSNKFVIRATQSVTLARMNSASPTVAAAVASGDDRILTAILDGQNRLLEALTNRPAVDPIAQLTQTIGLMTSMREAMGITNTAPQKSSIAEIVDAVKELKGIQSLIGGEDKEPTSLLSLAPQLLDTMKAMMPNQQALPPQHQPQQAFPALNVPASFAENPITDQQSIDARSAQSAQPQLDLDDPDMLEFLALLANIKKHVIPAAGDVTKIEDTAELLLDKAPEQLHEVFEQENWFELLKQFAPQYIPAMVPILEPHRVWLTAVRDHLVKLLKEEAQ